MPTLVLPPRYTEDTNRVRKAAAEAGWGVERLQGWRAPDSLRDSGPVLYGEPLFAAVVADTLGLAMIEPPFDWLTTIPREWLRREVRFMTLAEARRVLDVIRRASLKQGCVSDHDAKWLPVR